MNHLQVIWMVPSVVPRWIKSPLSHSSFLSWRRGGHSEKVRAGTLVWVSADQRDLFPGGSGSRMLLHPGWAKSPVLWSRSVNRVPGESPHKSRDSTSYRFGDPVLTTQVLLWQGVECLGPHLGEFLSNAFQFSAPNKPILLYWELALLCQALIIPQEKKFFITDAVLWCPFIWRGGECTMSTCWAVAYPLQTGVGTKGSSPNSALISCVTVDNRPYLYEPLCPRPWKEKLQSFLIYIMRVDSEFSKELSECFVNYLALTDVKACHWPEVIGKRTSFFFFLSSFYWTTECIKTT